MTALSSPLFALRAQRDGLRQKQHLIARTRSGGQIHGLQDSVSSAATECVSKRLPAIGDTPSRNDKRG